MTFKPSYVLCSGLFCSGLLFSVVAIAAPDTVLIQDITVQPLDETPATLIPDQPAKAAAKKKPAAKPKKTQPRNPSVTYRLPSGGRYTGGWNRLNQPHGKGFYIAVNGDEYQGGFKHGLFHGEGVLHFVNGDIYRGNWRDGKQSGQGVMQYKDGNLYQGQWQNGLRHGKGVLKYRSGSRYEGDWKLDQRAGKGMYVSSSGQRYVGDYQANKAHGKGVEVTANGESYSGTFSKGNKHGVGECALRNADLSICLYDRGRRIFDPELLLRAERYYKKQKPKYEFTKGIGFLFEDHFTRQRRWLTNEVVSWQFIEALFANQLRIESNSTQQSIRFVIDDYEGPGTYELVAGKAQLSIAGLNEPIGLKGDERLTLIITADNGKVIEGTFNAAAMMTYHDNQERRFTLRNGRFEATVQKAVP